MTNKVAYIGIMGLPNAGKSTLVNAFLGKKVSIISPRPHTTQTNILGVLNISETSQIVFIDTPGISKGGARHWDNEALHNLFVIDAHKKCHKSDIAALEDIIAKLKIIPEKPSTHKESDANLEKTDSVISSKEHESVDSSAVELPSTRSKSSITVVLNKIDIVNKARILPLINLIKQYCEDIFIISAKCNDGSNDLLNYMLLRTENISEASNQQKIESSLARNKEFMVCEMIREQIFLQTKKELPYVTKVSVDSWQEVSVQCETPISEKLTKTEVDSKNKNHNASSPLNNSTLSDNAGEQIMKTIIEIHASIEVEKLTHKKILIGDNAQRIKEISMMARKEISAFVHGPIRLFVHVIMKKSR
jgi:GTP-binding protein Era